MDLAEIQKSPEKALELIQSMSGQIEHLTEELRLALHRKYGRSSERIAPCQKELFEEDALLKMSPV
ncbi:IS66 family transposase [Sediminispirochaeta bajacaliforniensis]|uniref:IS66 family transposase n=1 Tax=Sediminispirochaeta bajacaliforniensis TaxID=148 RepID=UPI000373E506|nr:hypothetical protein [Sediminispirochaeta bajacaliforniensis]